jgi:hypothetical protein
MNILTNACAPSKKEKKKRNQVPPFSSQFFGGPELSKDHTRCSVDQGAK